MGEFDFFTNNDQSLNPALRDGRTNIIIYESHVFFTVWNKNYMFAINDYEENRLYLLFVPSLGCCQENEIAIRMVLRTWGRCFA